MRLGKNVKENWSGQRKGEVCCSESLTALIDIQRYDIMIYYHKSQYDITVIFNILRLAEISNKCKLQVKLCQYLYL